MTTFSELGLSPLLQRAVEEMGFREPMPIQAEVIPLVLAGRDVLGRSQTGTGKTAAFALPILHKLLPASGIACRALVIAPTRELAAQVHGHMESLAKHTPLKGILIVGGEDAARQEDALRRGCDWIVATPGRLRDHLLHRFLPLEDIEFLVLDEADQLLELGFVTDIRSIVSYCPDRRQTMMFSATLPREMESLARSLLDSPARIETGETRVADPVSEGAWPVSARQKYQLLLEILKRQSLRHVLVFCRTRVRSDKLCQFLVAHGIGAGILHADRTMEERKQVLQAFRSGELDVLVATDIAARGLDIDGVDHVVNFDVPVAPEDYIHRVGRTGRAGRPGEALTLYSERELVLLARIEHLLHKPIPVRKLEGFDYEVETPDSARPIRQRERKAVNPGTRHYSAEKKDSPFTKTGKAKRKFAADSPGNTKPAKIRKNLPHRKKN